MLPNKTFWCHWHDEVEFLYVYSGQVTYHVNGEHIAVQAGEAIFVNAQQLHYGYSADGSDGTYLCLILSPLLLCTNAWFEETFIIPIVENKNFPFLLLKPGIAWMDEILTLLPSLYQIYKAAKPGYPLELQSCYFKMWHLLFLHQPAPEVKTRVKQGHTDEMKKMLTYIHLHSHEKITLSDISAAGNMCQSSCFRLFKKYLGRTLTETITEYRISQARKLLSETSLSITDIATQVGFSGASYFTEMFRRWYNCTPSEYRRQNRNM